MNHQNATVIPWLTTSRRAALLLSIVFLGDGGALIHAGVSPSAVADRHDGKPTRPETSTDPSGVALVILASVEDHSHEGVVGGGGAKLPVDFVQVSGDHDQPSLTIRGSAWQSQAHSYWHRRLIVIRSFARSQQLQEGLITGNAP